jgi:homoaconitate hydratase
VAASAVAGYIRAPGQFDAADMKTSVNRRASAAREARDVREAVLDGFPARVQGRVLWMPKDNLNTDGIYAGKWTYKDDMTPEAMAGVTFENYDPDFNAVYQSGDIVVSGRNFGSGSSREQAATALKFKGIPCVIAYSFSETYKRNAFNNGFPVIECPELVEHLSKAVPGDGPTRVGPDIEIDFEGSVVHCDGREFPFPALGKVPQELIIAGGAENLVRGRLDG